MPKFDKEKFLSLVEIKDRIPIQKLTPEEMMCGFRLAQIFRKLNLDKSKITIYLREGKIPKSLVDKINNGDISTEENTLKEIKDIFGF